MSEVKNSGIPWIGDIPRHWKTVQAKFYCLSVYAGGTPDSNKFEYWDGDIPWLPSGACHDCEVNEAHKFITQLGFDNSSTKYIPSGTTIMAMTGATCANTGFVLFDTCANQSVAAYVPRDTTYSKYLFYALQAARQYILTYQTGGAQAGINIQNCKSFIVPYLPYHEQKAIADFLDIKCAEIDELISLQEKIVSELKDYKQSLIAEAVTKGLNPNVEMKPCTAKWIKSIPCHWDEMLPKVLFVQRKDKAIEGEKQLTSSQLYGIVYQEEYMELTGAKVVTVMKDFDILKHVEVGDFVISMRSFQGGLEYSTKRGSISSAYVMLIPNLEYVYPPYFRWLFKSLGYINALQSTSNMVRDGQAMRYSNFAQVGLFAPPKEEQREIADYLNRKCSEIDSLLSLKQSKIESLKEYKKSLIYEYVTGKKEVKA